jgi:putative addiction module antidote
MTALKIIAVGSSSGVVLPKDVLRDLNVARGDTLHLVRTETGDHVLTALSPEAVRQLDVARELMRHDRELLRALADK